MLVMPAVDISEGKCVQLVGGEPGTGGEYGSPVDAALKWEEKGAKCIHNVDLDAAMGEGENIEEISDILESVSIEVQVSGGIRSVEKGINILEMGAERVILGTAAFEEPEVLENLVEEVGSERVMVALDVKEGQIAVEGWKEKARDDVVKMAKKFEEIGVGGFLFTNVDVEGRMAGIKPEPISKLVKLVDSPIVAAGGVKSIEDVKKAKEAGASALVIGTALYEGKVSLKKAMETAR